MASSSWTSFSLSTSNASHPQFVVDSSKMQDPAVLGKRRVPSPWSFFLSVHSAQIRPELGHARPEELLASCLVKWQNLNDSQRAAFTELAERARRSVENGDSHGQQIGTWDSSEPAFDQGRQLSGTLSKRLRQTARCVSSRSNCVQDTSSELLGVISRAEPSAVADEASLVMNSMLSTSVFEVCPGVVIGQFETALQTFGASNQIYCVIKCQRGFTVPINLMESLGGRFTMANLLDIFLDGSYTREMRASTLEQLCGLVEAALAARASVLLSFFSDLQWPVFCAMAYLIVALGWSFQQAFSHLKTVIPGIGLDPRAIEALATLALERGQREMGGAAVPGAMTSTSAET
mmetsp:Transcript_368/g.713  ORF Transcript_368/g.713 Transcript_368/m.713 type:complete len:348 (-) Transcript_368:66-1109(-)